MTLRRPQLLTYAWSDARKDIVAGLTVAAIALPQAMAYALIAGIDPRFGLYSAIVITAIASILGSSAHLINGPTNAISLVVFSALAFLGSAPSSEIHEAMFLLAAMVGVIQIGVALFKLGDLTRYISESVVLGFMAGAGFLVAITQIGNILGLKQGGTGDQHVLHRLWLTLTEGGRVDARTLGIGAGTIIVVVLLRRIARRHSLPRLDMLFALVLASVVTLAFGWAQGGPDGRRAVPVIGDIPAGLPHFHAPELRREWISQMTGSALAIALLGLLEALSIAKAIAHQTHQSLNYNRQCFAEGIANLGGGFFQCLPGSGSLTRSAINFQAGGVTRWSGVFAAVTVGIAVALFAPYARFIPKAALAGILMVTAAGLFDRRRLKRAVRASRYDAGLVIVTALSAVVVSVTFSILIGVGLSILLFVPRAARLKYAELVIGEDRRLRERRPQDPRCQRIVILDLEGELFFGAAPELDRCLDQVEQEAPAGLRSVVLRVKRTRNPDMVCMERLLKFIGEMQGRGVAVLLAGVRPDFEQAMHNLRFRKWLPPDHVFLEDPAVVGSATLSAVRHAYAMLGSDLCETCPRNVSRAESGEFAPLNLGPQV